VALENQVDKFMNSLNILSHLLVALKTNYANQNKFAFVRYNQFLIDVLFILYKDGIIDSYEIIPQSFLIKIKLRYFKNKPVIKFFKLISKPSYKVYLTSKNLLFLNKKYDYLFLSTSKGLISSLKLQDISMIGGQPLFGLRFSDM